MLILELFGTGGAVHVPLTFCNIDLYMYQQKEGKGAINEVHVPKYHSYIDSKQFIGWLKCFFFFFAGSITVW